MQKVRSNRFRLSHRATSTRTALLAGLSLATAVLGGCGAAVDSSIDDTASAAGSNNTASAAGSGKVASAAASDNAAGAGGTGNAAVEGTTQELAAPSESVSYTSFDWYQGWGTVDMQPWGTHVCVLTRISGSFRGAGESIRIFKGSNGFWQMNGTSGQAGVLARSYCFKMTNFTASGSIERWLSDEFVTQAQAWDSNCGWFGCTRHIGSSYTNMWLNDSMAYLTGVGGAFDGEGEAAWVSDETAPFPTQVNAQTGADVTNYLTVRAHNFFVGVPHSGHVPIFWGPSWPYRGNSNQVHGYSASHWQSGVGETWMAATNDAMCFITSIQGGFWGNGEIVEMFAAMDGSTERWKLRVTNGTNSTLGAGAYCYSYNQD
jgi:hypothetical protein